MTQKNKSILKNHFFYNWYVYIIIILVASLLTSWISSNITRTRLNEKVQLFVGAIQVDKPKMVDCIKNGSDETLREVNILSYILEDQYFETYLTVAGVTETDFIILPEKYATTSFVEEYCMVLDQYQDKLNDEINFDFIYQSYTVSGGNSYNYGIKVYDKEENYSILDEFITYNLNESNYNKYYLFINKTTVNISSIRSLEGDNSNHAIEALRKLINYEE